MRYGFWGGIDWQMGKLPADFLIGSDGRILKAHYGRDIGDDLSLTEVEATLTPGSLPASDLSTVRSASHAPHPRNQEPKRELFAKRNFLC